MHALNYLLYIISNERIKHFYYLKTFVPAVINLLTKLDRDTINLYIKCMSKKVFLSFNEKQFTHINTKRLNNNWLL